MGSQRISALSCLGKSIPGEPSASCASYRRTTSAGNRDNGLAARQYRIPSQCVCRGRIGGNRHFLSQRVHLYWNNEDHPPVPSTRDKRACDLLSLARSPVRTEIDATYGAGQPLCIISQRPTSSGKTICTIILAMARRKGRVAELSSDEDHETGD